MIDYGHIPTWIGLAVGVSVIAGLLPSVKAARLEPLETLRLGSTTPSALRPSTDGVLSGHRAPVSQRVRAPPTQLAPAIAERRPRALPPR